MPAPDLRSAGTSPPPPRDSAWSVTSRTCAPGRAGCYLATVIDLCTRMVVGWAIADAHAHQPGLPGPAMARDGGYLTGRGGVPLRPGPAQ